MTKAERLREWLDRWMTRNDWWVFPTYVVCTAAFLLMCAAVLVGNAIAAVVRWLR